MSPRANIRFTLVVVVLALVPALAQKKLTSNEAKGHIGEKATVCGKVVSTLWATGSPGSPTFLNFDKPYPSQIFTMLIWGTDRPKFGQPETTYRGNQVCVTGKITSFKGIPEVIATDPSQVKTIQ